MLLIVSDCRHDDRNIGKFRVAAQRRQYGPAVDIRHQDVESDRDRVQLFGNALVLRARRRR